jgi:lysophospholipase L1-like esterase
LFGFGDSYTSGGKGSYPIVAGNLLQWSARNFAIGGAKMSGMPGQLATASAFLANATHVVFTIGGNDLGVSESLQQIILKNNFTAVANKARSLKPQLVLTYKLIKGAVRPGTKLYAIPYVNFISVGNKIPNDDDCHRLLDVLSDTVKAAAQEANIGFIEAVKSSFLGHEIYSAEPYANGLNEPNAAHPNVKGYNKIGEVVADYLKLH